MQDDVHFRTGVRYVERNPLRAKLVRRAQDWPWSSLGQAGAIERYNPPADSDEAYPAVRLCPWPVSKPRDWPRQVNVIMTPAEEAAVQRSMKHSRPLGDEAWTRRMEERLNLPPLRPTGRPRKVVDQLVFLRSGPVPLSSPRSASKRIDEFSCHNYTQADKGLWHRSGK